MFKKVSSKNKNHRELSSRLDWDLRWNRLKSKTIRNLQQINLKVFLAHQEILGSSWHLSIGRVRGKKGYNTK